MVTKVYSFLIGALLSLLSSSVLADWQMNMSPGVTPISKQMFGLHMTVIWICVAIGIIVFGVMIYSLIMHRKSRGVSAATFHEHPVLEVVWAIIPFIILVLLAIPATRVTMDMKDTTEADVTIKIVGYQWKWQYQYLDQNISFFSNLSTPMDQIRGKAKKGEWYLLEVDNPLVLPVNKKVRFLVTAHDVVHSWWVPALGVKRDAIPGFIHESWARIEEPGVYRGQCAELCGVFHGFMPIVVKVVSEEEFDKWVKQQNPQAATATAKQATPQPTAAPQPSQPQAQPQQAQAPATPKPTATKPTAKTWTRDELMKKGEAEYKKFCVACHKEDGTGMPPVFPALKASSVAVGHPISRHIDIVLHGVKNTSMQAFASQMTDEEIAAVITYERNAWGNKTGELIQPTEVAKQRK